MTDNMNNEEILDNEEKQCDCGGECDNDNCGSSCGSCGGGCSGCGGGKPAYAFEGPNVGKNVKVNYRGTLNDGTQFDSSYDRGQTLDFLCGAGMMIKGFDKAVATMKVGETVNIHLMPEEAYGDSDPEKIFTVEISEIPGADEVEVNEKVYLYNQFGQPIPVTVAGKTETTITFDANHDMAGKELNFEITLVEVE